MTSKLIIIVIASIAVVFGMFLAGKLLDRCGTEVETTNGGAQ